MRPVGRSEFRKIPIVAKEQHRINKLSAVGPFEAVDDGKARMHAIGRTARRADQVGQCGADLVGRLRSLFLAGTRIVNS